MARFKSLWDAWNKACQHMDEHRNSLDRGIEVLQGDGAGEMPIQPFPSSSN
jgi:hypothetical protein